MTSLVTQAVRSFPELMQPFRSKDRDTIEWLLPLICILVAAVGGATPWWLFIGFWSSAMALVICFLLLQAIHRFRLHIGDPGRINDTLAFEALFLCLSLVCIDLFIFKMMDLPLP